MAPSPRTPAERNSTFNGFSLIADPSYNLLANASTDEVETISATVDLGDANHKYLSERRPELYRAVTKPMTPAVLGVNAEPQSSVAGAEAQVDVSFATTALPAGTPVTARIVDSAEATIAQATGALGTVPAANASLASTIQRGEHDRADGSRRRPGREAARLPRAQPHRRRARRPGGGGGRAIRP